MVLGDAINVPVSIYNNYDHEIEVSFGVENNDGALSTIFS